MKSKTKILFGSAMTIAMCASLIAGSTFALFTSESKTNIAITSGKVSVTASAELVEAYSAKWQGDDYTKETRPITENRATFTNDGTVAYRSESNTLDMANISPGDGAKIKVSIKNESTIAIKYKISVVAGADDGLFEGLKASISSDEDGVQALDTSWKSLAAKAEIEAVYVNVELPIETKDQNLYQEKSCSLSVIVNAMQGNGHVTEVSSSGTGSLRDTLRSGTSPSVELTSNLNSGAQFYMTSEQVSQTVDLNGHILRGPFHSFGFDWDSETPYTQDTDIYIRNGTIISSTEQTKPPQGYGYGLALIGGREEDTGTVTLHLDNVHITGTFVGLSTNGMDRGVKIIANNCTFEGGISGVYLPADAECEFNGCTFIGMTGICARAGKVTLNNCTVKGQGAHSPLTYFPSGQCGGNGSAILIPGSDGSYKMLKLTINGGKLVSENGYGIEELCGLPLTQGGSTYPDCHLESLTVTDTEVSCKLGAMYISENQGTSHAENSKNWKVPAGW